METELLIAIIITNICFIGVAFITNENNADMLLAGYNTMSKKEKESFDLKNYLIFFKKFFINLAIYSSLIFLFFYVAFDELIANGMSESEAENAATDVAIKQYGEIE